MPAIQVRLRVTDDVLKRYKTLYGDARVKERLYRSLAAVLREFRRRALLRLRRVPGEPNRPIRFTSDRQRRAVIAFLKVKFPNESTYQRTNRFVNAWELEQERERGGVSTVLIRNKARMQNAVRKLPYYWQYVVGTFDGREKYQQRFHATTGWYNLHDELYGANGIQIELVVVTEEAVLRFEKEAIER